MVAVDGTDRRGEEAIVVANVAIKSIDFPYHQHHALVTVPTGSEALAGNAAESDALNAAEDRLTEAMAGASGSMSVVSPSVADG